MIEHTQPQGSPPSPCLPDFIPLAKKLQETVEALLDFSQSTTSPESVVIDGADDDKRYP